MSASGQGDVAAIESLFTRYVQFLNEGDADSIGAQIYRPPVLSVNADGTHIAIPTGEALAHLWKTFLDGQTKMGVQGRSLESVNICLLGDDVAMAAVVISLRRANVATPQRNGWLYLLQKTKGEWRNIMVAPRSLTTHVTCSG